jgi:FAD/FMN-containing dehydrogenase
VYTFAVCASPEGCLLSPRRTYLGTSDIVTRPLDAGGVDTLVRGIEALQANAAAGTGGVLLDALGGAVNRPSPDETAFVHRDGRFVIQYDAFWPVDASRSVVDASIAWNRDYRAAMGPYVSGQAYQNYIDPSLAGWEQAYYGANLARLREIKRRVDPGGVFRFAQSIPPA